MTLASSSGSQFHLAKLGRKWEIKKYWKHFEASYSHEMLSADSLVKEGDEWQIFHDILF